MFLQADNIKHSHYPPARLQSILSSNGPITFIISHNTNSPDLSVALRLAHDLQIYHRLDSEILSESEIQTCLLSGRLPPGNIVFIGKQSSVFPRALLSEKRTPFEAKGNVLELNGQVLDDPSTGLCSSIILLKPSLHLPRIYLPPSSSCSKSS